MALTGSGARRYAEAILSLASGDRDIAPIRASLDRVAGALDRATVAALRNPAVPLANREAALLAATKDEPVVIRSILRLLIERDRIALAPQIARAFGDLVDRRQGIAKARITTAVPLDESERDRLVRRLEQRTKNRVRATFLVDPALISGTTIQLGDHLVDASLEARLRALARQLAS